MFSAASAVGGHLLVAVKALDAVFGDSHIELLFDQLVGNAVIVALDFNVVIDVDSGLFPFGKLVAPGGQRF